MMYHNRGHAGRVLAGLLGHLKGRPLVVVGLPRGGVEVGYEVASALEAPLEVLLVRKLGVPFQPELAMGAIGEGGIRILDRKRIKRLGIPSSEIEQVEQQERQELARQAEHFRGGHEAAGLEGRTAVIVDDGIATGSTALAACPIASNLGADQVIVAAPVGPREAFGRFREVADQVVIAQTPKSFLAIGMFYRDFAPTPDKIVIDLLNRRREELSQSRFPE
ncbi:MAG: hypothetical protein F4X21_03980 [Acidimicrobiia bacterium]|nr:phosphoribosyltransferase family protein [bacterium]MYD04066.1 hypothetical protein [Acidimicrobiia bacterium]